jgi:hypothetical protein
MALPSINDKNFISAPITLNRVNHRNNNTSELIQLRREVAFIDREINAHENYMSITKQLIAGNKELIKLHQEQKQIIFEQKENINKRIGLLEKNNELLNGMLEKRHNRSKSVQPFQPSKLEEVNTLPKGRLIREQKAKLESDVKKHNIAIDYHNNKLDKLTNSDKAKDVTDTTKPSKKEGLATGYKPTNPIDTLRTDSKPDTVKSSSSSSYISNFSSQQQRYIAQSQTNIWDSIVAANIRKLI